MVSSNETEIVDLARSFAHWGRDCYCTGAANLLPCGTCGKRFDKWIDGYDVTIDHKYFFTNIAYNLKPLDLQGAIGLVQLEKFDDIASNRELNSLSIRGSLAVLEQYGCKTVWESRLESRACWFGVPIICDNPEIKFKLQQHFETNRIQTRNYFAGNILRQPAYKHLDNYADYPVADQVLSKVLFIGCAPHYRQPHLEYIDKVIREFKP
jgi:CDP-6-deoxy-D-xylo-4-hexulose-3-dehydrase